MVSVEFLDFEPTFQDDATKSCVSHGNLIGKFVSNNLAAIGRWLWHKMYDSHGLEAGLKTKFKTYRPAPFCSQSPKP